MIAATQRACRQIRSRIMRNTESAAFQKWKHEAEQARDHSDHNGESPAESMRLDSLVAGYGDGEPSVRDIDDGKPSLTGIMRGIQGMQTSIDRCEQRVLHLSDWVSRLASSDGQHHTARRQHTQEESDHDSIQLLQASIERCEKTVQQTAQQLSDRFARCEGRWEAERTAGRQHTSPNSNSDKRKRQPPSRRAPAAAGKDACRHVSAQPDVFMHNADAHPWHAVMATGERLPDTSLTPSASVSADAPKRSASCDADSDTCSGVAQDVQTGAISLHVHACTSCPVGEGARGHLLCRLRAYSRYDLVLVRLQCVEGDGTLAGTDV